jgi:hypothetical protein
MSDGAGMLQSPFLIKAVSSAVIAGTFDRFVLGIDDTKQNAIFGGSVAAGIVVGSMIGYQVPSIISDTTYYNGKTIAQRSFEVIFGVGTSYALYVSTNEVHYDDLYKRVGVVVATDFIAEYITDYFIGNPLSYLA